jgi:hypothetical protein
MVYSCAFVESVDAKSLTQSSLYLASWVVFNIFSDSGDLSDVPLSAFPIDFFPRMIGSSLEILPWDR